MVYYVRKALMTDFENILPIFENARESLKNQRIPQWQNNTGPNEQSISSDISLEEAYVLIENNHIVGYGAINKEKQLAYERIVEGAFESVGKYASIHRFAIHSAVKQKGLGFFLLGHLISFSVLLGFKDIRIDTHALNVRMKKVIEKSGFTKCGMVRLDIKNGERIAYQLLIN